VEIRAALDQDLVVVAASSDQIVVIAVRMAQDGVTSQHPIAQHALVASTPLKVPHSALALATLSAAQVGVASGATIAVIVAMMVRVGVISRAPTVQLVRECLMAALHRQLAGEIDAV